MTLHLLPLILLISCSTQKFQCAVRVYNKEIYVNDKKIEFMKRIDDRGVETEIVHSTIDRFKKLCPSCGDPLVMKKIKKQRNMYRRGLRSYVCQSCGYAEYDSNEREQMIIDGQFDELL